MVSLNDRIQQSSSVELTDLSDALLLTAASGKVMFGVNGVGRRIVQLLAAPQTLDDMVAILEREFSVDRQACERDVREFLGELAEHGFIENC